MTKKVKSNATFDARQVGAQAMCSYCSGAAIAVGQPLHTNASYLSRQVPAHRQTTTPSLQHTLHGFLLTNNPSFYLDFQTIVFL